MHNALCASRHQNDVFSSAKWTHAILKLPKPSSKTVSHRLECVVLLMYFQLLHNVLHPSWPQDDVSLSRKQSPATLHLLEPFHLIMGLPGFETTYHRPLNALRHAGKCFQLFHNVLHPSWAQDDVSSSANRSHITLQLLEPFDLAMSLPSFETTFRYPLNALSMCWQIFQPFHNVLHPSWPQDNVSSSANWSHSFQTASTSPWVSEASRRRIAVR